ncbi:MAG: aminotransferase class III-fold pyridoxal phosphate-dependent enzyme [Planctomycetota bacterium]
MTRSTARSWQQYRELERHLGAGSSTGSKIPQYEGDAPALIVRGKGCRVWDLDGNEYIDFRNALGPVTLGYAVREIDDAVIAQLQEGIIFGHPHPLEGEVAALLCEVIPCAEKARFMKTGGEALAACIKIARAATGRDRVVHCGYNGWLNNLCAPAGAVPRGAAMAQPLRGVPAALAALHRSLPWGDLAAWEEYFRAHGRETAAAVVACSYGDMEQGHAFLPAVRALTAQYDTLLVMDEIVTGFRLALGGAQEYFKITADMAVVGKGVANGMPISAYVGRAGLIDSAREVGITTTFGGETLALAATKAAIAFYRAHDVIGYLWRAGTDLWGRARTLIRQHRFPLELKGLDICPQFAFASPQAQEAFFRAAYRNGLSFYDVSYVNYAHRPDDITATLERLERALKEIA